MNNKKQLITLLFIVLTITNTLVEGKHQVKVKYGNVFTRTANSKTQQKLIQAESQTVLIQGSLQDIDYDLEQIFSIKQNPATLSQPCISEESFQNIYSNINAWQEVLRNPDQLESDITLLKAARDLIQLSQDSAQNVQEEFQIRYKQGGGVNMIQASTNLIQVFSQINLNTQVVQSIFQKEINSILKKISLVQSQNTQEQSIFDQAQEILNEIDKIGIELTHLVSQRDQFDQWISDLADVRLIVDTEYKYCNAPPGSADVEFKEADSRPNSATLDEVTQAGSVEIDTLGGSAGLTKQGGSANVTLKEDIYLLQVNQKKGSKRRQNIRKNKKH